ncbi:unnamed protein product [Sphagnum compactum]
MGRKRVLALGPALSRMRSYGQIPYEKIKGHDQQLPGGGASTKSSSRIFWGWRRKPKKLKLGGKKTRSGRWGFKVSRLRIRLVSPLVLLKKLRDSYVRMMLALERSCGEYGGSLAMTSYPIYPLYPFPISTGRTIHTFV